MYQDELEEFLQDEINDHRMYPSDQIWRNIQAEVHGPQTWPALTFISLFIISALTVATLLNNHPNQIAGKLVALKNLNNKKPVTDNPTPLSSDFNAISPEQVTASTIAQIETFCESFQHILMAVSWGGYESLILPKCAGMQSDQFDAENPAHRSLRIYIGLEEPDYLKQDLLRAFNSIANLS